MATQELTVDSLVQVQEPCVECQGTGEAPDGLCYECGGAACITRWVTLAEMATFIAGQLAAAVSCEHARPRGVTTRK